MMRVVLFAAATLVALAAPAGAADLRLPLNAPGVDPAYRWTGCYLGGHAGQLWHQERWVNRTVGGAFPDQPLGQHHSNNALVGVQAGCDYQFAGGFVAGLAGDYAFTDAVGSHPSTVEIGVDYNSRVRSLASATGRLGYAFDRVLGYVKGGAAWERDEYWPSTILTGPAFFGRATRAGWTIGVGGEYAFTNYLSGFVEYNFYDFGTRRITLTPLLFGLNPAAADIQERTNVIRAGFNVRFGG
jgi:outer membrane immunogenic protein